MTVRQALAQIFESKWWQGYKLLAKTDARKVELEYHGNRRPTPSSTFAQALVAIARRFPPASPIPLPVPKPPPPPPLPPPPTSGQTVFSKLGGYVANAAAFTPDSPKGQAFLRAGGQRLHLQFFDPVSHTRNVTELSLGWASAWQQKGVTILGWHRMNHPGDPVREARLRPVSGWSYNSEEREETDRLNVELQAYRANHPTHLLSVACLGKMPYFPTGLLQQLDAHLEPECFPEEGSVDDTVTGSVQFWVASHVNKTRIHPLILFSGAVQRLPVVAAAEAEQVGVRGLASFTAEQTPAAAWQVLA